MPIGVSFVFDSSGKISSLFQKGVMLQFDLDFLNGRGLCFETSAYKTHLNVLVVTKVLNHWCHYFLSIHVLILLPYFWDAH